MCVVEKGTHLQVLGFRNYERVMELTTGCISLTLNNRNEVSYSEGKNHNLLEITEMPTCWKLVKKKKKKERKKLIIVRLNNKLNLAKQQSSSHM